MYWRTGGRKNLPSQGRKSYSYGGLDDVVDLEALAAFTAVDSDADDDDSTALAAGMSARARCGMGGLRSDRLEHISVQVLCKSK